MLVPMRVFTRRTYSMRGAATAGGKRHCGSADGNGDVDERMRDGKTIVFGCNPKFHRNTRATEVKREHESRIPELRVLTIFGGTASPRNENEQLSMFACRFVDYRGT